MCKSSTPLYLTQLHQLRINGSPDFTSISISPVITCSLQGAESYFAAPEKTEEPMGKARGREIGLHYVEMLLGYWSEGVNALEGRWHLRERKLTCLRG